MYTFDVLSLHYSCYSICIFFPFLLKTSLVYMWVLVQYCFLVCYTEGGLSLRISLSAVMCHCYLSYKKKIPQNQNLQFSGARQSWAAEVWTAGRWWFTVLYSGTRDSYHGCAANKSAARLWSCDVNMNQTLWGMIPAPCWIYAMKN